MKARRHFRALRVEDTIYNLGDDVYVMVKKHYASDASGCCKIHAPLSVYCATIVNINIVNMIADRASRINTPVLCMYALLLALLHGIFFLYQIAST